jgi:hypothetical protein
MLTWAAVLLFIALLAYADRLGWITGKPVIDAGYFGLIITALCIMFLLCFLLTWKLQCPIPDKWINLDCFKLALVTKEF